MLLAPFLEPLPVGIPRAGLLPAIGWTMAAGGLWWGASVAALMWSAARLDPARVGLLLMAEVLVGAVSAALLAGERLGPWEIVGGGLVVCAGILEVGPMPARRDGRSPP